MREPDIAPISCLYLKVDRDLRACGTHEQDQIEVSASIRYPVLNEVRLYDDVHKSAVGGEDDPS